MSTVTPDASRSRRHILTTIACVVVVLCLALLWLITSVQATLDGTRHRAEEQRQASAAVEDLVDDAVIEEIVITATGGGKSGEGVRAGFEAVLTDAAVDDAEAIHRQLRSLTEAHCFRQLSLHLPGGHRDPRPLIEISPDTPTGCAVIPSQETMAATYRQGRQLDVEWLRIISPNGNNRAEVTYRWFPDSAAGAEDRIASWTKAGVPPGVESLTLSVTGDIIREEATLSTGETFRPQPHAAESEPLPPPLPETETEVTPDSRVEIAPGVTAGVAERVRSVLDDVDPHLLAALAEDGVRILVADTPVTGVPGFEDAPGTDRQVHTLDWSLPLAEVPYHHFVPERLVYVNGLSDEDTVAGRLLLALGDAVDHLLHRDDDPDAPAPLIKALMEAERGAVLGPPTERELQIAAVDETTFTGYPGHYFAHAFALHHSPDPADREHLRHHGPRTHAYLLGLPTAMLELTAITGEEITITWPAHPTAADYEILIDGRPAGVTEDHRYTVEAPNYRDHVLQVIARDEEGRALIRSRPVDSATTVIDSAGVRAELDEVIYGDGPRYRVREQVEQVEELLDAHRARTSPDGPGDDGAAGDHPGQNDFNRLLDEIRAALAETDPRPRAGGR